MLLELKPDTKKDSHEGSIFKDPDYLEFFELIATPFENLPSAEVQLERKEAEPSGALKEAPVVAIYALETRCQE